MGTTPGPVDLLDAADDNSLVQCMTPEFAPHPMTVGIIRSTHPIEVVLLLRKHPVLNSQIRAWLNDNAFDWMAYLEWSHAHVFMRNIQDEAFLRRAWTHSPPHWKGGA